MKIKGVSPLELHIEKIILLAAIGFSCLVFYMFVLGEPYTVDVGGQPKAPGEVQDVIVQKAEDVKRLIGPTSNNPLENEDLQVPDYTAIFLSRMQDRVFDQPTYEGRLGLGGVAEITGTDLGRFDRTFSVPEPPAPNSVFARSGYYVLGQHKDPAIDAELVKFANIASSDLPRDFRGVSIKAEFPTADWQSAIAEGLKKWDLKERLFMKIRVVGDVIIERQIQDRVSGRWGVIRRGRFVVSDPDNDEEQFDIIDALPGAVSFRKQADSDSWTAEEAEKTRNELTILQAEVTQASFPPLAQGSPEWLPPDINIDEWDIEDQRKRVHLNAETKKVEDMLRKLGADPDATLDTPDPEIEEYDEEDEGEDFTKTRDPKTGKPRTKPFSGSRTKTGTTTRAKRLSPKEKRIKSLQEQLIKQRAELQELKDKYAAGPDAGEEAEPGETEPEDFDPDEVERRPPPGPRLTPIRPGGPQADEENEDGELTGPIGPDSAEEERLKPIPLIAHDLTVEPGQTYRYRIRVGVLNPLFQTEHLSEEMKQRYMDKLTLKSQSSDWTDPIMVDPRYYLFVTKAMSERDEATVEVWHIFNGKWRVKEFTVNPGDPIGGKDSINEGGFKSEVDLDLGMVMVDVEKLEGVARPGSNPSVFLFLDLATGSVIERFPDQDIEDQKRIELKNRAENSVAAVSTR